MLHSLLLHLEPAHRADAVIRLAVRLAKRGEARLRGLTLLDTRRADSTEACEAAAYAVAEQSRHVHALARHRRVRGDLSQACLDAGVDFDVRRLAGNPLEALPREARFHDLMITSLPGASASERSRDLSARDLAVLVERGVQPLLVLPESQRAIKRVLIPFDGTAAASRALRAFLSLNICTDAEHRLLCVAESERAARASLREMTGYCGAHDRPLETGFVCGKLRRVLLPYARKWEADLIVLGLNRGHRLLRPLVSNLAVSMLDRLPCGLFITS